jgi:acetolactate synthase-1/2/3 large subunit
VLDIDGNRSFSMTLTELSTAAQYDIDVKVLILNNNELGMVTQWQRLFYEHQFSHSRQKTLDFAMLASAMGIEAQRCTELAEVAVKLQWLIQTEGSALLEVMTNSNARVLLMYLLVLPCMNLLDMMKVRFCFDLGSKSSPTCIVLANV